MKRNNSILFNLKIPRYISDKLDELPKGFTKKGLLRYWIVNGFENSNKILKEKMGVKIGKN